jgi:hypothetical protein
LPIDISLTLGLFLFFQNVKSIDKT